MCGPCVGCGTGAHVVGGFDRDALFVPQGRGHLPAELVCRFRRRDGAIESYYWYVCVCILPCVCVCMSVSCPFIIVVRLGPVASRFSCCAFKQVINILSKNALSPFSTPLCLFSRKSQILLLLSYLFVCVCVHVECIRQHQHARRSSDMLKTKKQYKHTARHWKHTVLQFTKRTHVDTVPSC